MSALDLNKFYFDRIWLKAYPAFFADLRNPLSWETFKEYRDNGVFEKWTDSVFRLYRTLDLIRRARREGVDIKDAYAYRNELRRYGEDDYYEFEVVDEGHVRVKACRDVKVSLASIDSVRFVAYYVVVGDRPRYEKAVYFEYAPWLRVMIKPFLEGFVPPMIRLFYNPLIRAKRQLGLGDFGLEAQHENYVDPSAQGFDEFLKLNHAYAFDGELEKIASSLWRVWFCDDVDLVVKVSQVEFSFDSELPKLELAKAFHVVGGKSKTIKHSVDGVKYSWTEGGLKYYITVKNGVQVKLYTKAWSKAKTLNRIEYTVRVNKPLEGVSAEEIKKTVADVHMQITKVLMDKELRAKLEEILRPIVRCRRNCDAHYAFWLDLLTAGQVKGSSYYRHVVETYKRLGLVKVKGRGRNSVYTLNENLLAVAENVRQFFGVSFSELSIPRVELNDEEDSI